MKEFSITELAEIIGADTAEDIGGKFTGVSIDSRTTKPGDCFFAISGENFDGNDYAAQALDKGAVCAVISKNIAGNNLLKVGDCVLALGSLAAEYRSQAKFKVVAITGSVGKTTTRQIVSHVLGQSRRVFQSPKNFNNSIGLPLTLLAAEPEDEIIIAELGSSYPGEIGQLTRIALPNIAVVTNVSQAHLAGFGDLQKIINEKLSIREGLAQGGRLIINGDSDRLLADCQRMGVEFTTFGTSERVDIRAQDVTHNGWSSSFVIDGVEVCLPLAGPGNVENAVAAWAVCKELGIGIDDFARSVRTVPAVSMRAEQLQIGSVTILNDCYNANPASMKNALEILAHLQREKKGRAVFICGDMAELGSQSEKLHTELGVSVAKAGVKLLLAVGKFAKVVAAAAKNGAEGRIQTKCFEDTRLLCDYLSQFAKDSDIILIKGSRSNELEMVVEKLKQLFGK